MARKQKMVDVTVRKYISGGYVETYETVISIPEKLLKDEDFDVKQYLLSTDQSDDFGDQIRFEDTIDDIEFEIVED